MPDYIVSFGSNLPKEEFLDDERRTQVYDAGIEAVKQIEGVRVITPLRSTGIALLGISEDVLDRCKQVLDGLDPPAGYTEETYEPIMRSALS